MNRRSDRWLGIPFSADTRASGEITASSFRKASYRDWVMYRLGSNFREKGKSPKAQLNTSELAITAVITGRRADSRRRARARIAVPKTSGIKGAEYCEVKEYWGS